VAPGGARVSSLSKSRPAPQPRSLNGTMTDTMTDTPALSTLVNQRIPYVPLPLVIDFMADPRFDMLRRQAQLRGKPGTEADVDAVATLWRLMVLEAAARHR
jgi:hypothetical protein